MILGLFLFSYFGLQFYLGRLKLKGEKKNPRVREGTCLARDSATFQASVVWLGLPATSTQGWETLPSAFGGDRVSTGLGNNNDQHSSSGLYCPSPTSQQLEGIKEPSLRPGPVLKPRILPGRKISFASWNCRPWQFPGTRGRVGRRLA